ncbi:MAG: hypothetical protein CBC00_06380 [Verrucomicrobia bacterium TMED40]|nr:MAG: hypothetical protein CBC00_06380 [Verrucomicrobia bacterium TMED40]
MSLRGGSEARDVAIHRVSHDANGECGSITGSQWIATGFALAMTKVGARDDKVGKARDDKGGSTRLQDSPCEAWL